MNYVWAQRETGERRGSSETIAVPFLDLKERKYREVLKRVSVAGEIREEETKRRVREKIIYQN